MKTPSECNTAGYGLLAYGTSPRWTVAIDEVLDQESEWSLQIEGPSMYLACSLTDPTVIGRIVHLFQGQLCADTASGENRGNAANDEVTIGAFGPAAVSLVRDDETSERWFIIIGPQEGAAVRWTLDKEDAAMLLIAFEQARHELPAGDETVPVQPSADLLSSATSTEANPVAKR